MANVKCEQLEIVNH